MSRSFHRHEAAQSHFELLGFEQPVESTPAPFSPGAAAHHAEEYGWTELSSHDEPMPFVAPTWEIFGPSATPDTSDAQLQEAVQAQVQAILQEAEREAQQIKEEAYAAGFAAGEQAGFETGQQRLEALLQQLRQTLQAVGELRGQILA